ncbi:MAG: DUF4350 domain-containing protein [Candidatus Hodarchaeota archaeon]
MLGHRFRLGIFLVIFGVSWLPLLLPLIGVGAISGNDYSIYNEGWNGLSSYRSIIEGAGYQVRPLLSSVSGINRINEPAILLAIGPRLFYDPIASTGMINFLNAGGSLLVADDFGSANFLLTYSGVIGPSFSGQMMLDTGSFDKNCALPVIRDFASHPITQGVSSIELNFPTVIGGVGFAPLAMTTTSSWLDADRDYEYDTGEYIGPFPVVGVTQVGNGSIVLVSDPSLFSNDMIDRQDNDVFARNIIDFLTGGDTDVLIVFDEGHLSWPLNSPILFFGTILSRINWMSSHWLLAPIYPLIAIYLIRSWLPKTKKPEEMKPSEVFRRVGRTFFSTKLRWYEVHQAYNQAIGVLYKRLKRSLIEQLRLRAFDVDGVTSGITRLAPALDEKDIRKTFKLLDDVVEGKKRITDRDEFLKIFFEMKRLGEAVKVK